MDFTPEVFIIVFEEIKRLEKSINKGIEDVEWAKICKKYGAKNAIH